MKARLLVIAAALGALVAFLFGRKRGPSDEARAANGELQKERKARVNRDADRDQGVIEDDRKRDVQAIKEEVAQDIDDLRSGGDDGYMARAFEYDSASPDDG